MLTEEQILKTLDETYQTGDYCELVSLGHPYSYLIDGRLNVFTGKDNKWAIAIERLGYNLRGGTIQLEIFYYGNCLINLEVCNSQITNYYAVSPIDDDSFFDSIHEPFLQPEATHWIVNGEAVNLSTNKQDYIDNNIELCELEPDTISIEEAARLAIISHSDLFRARDFELYKSIPSDLHKVLTLNEWYHRDFVLLQTPDNGNSLKDLFNFTQNLTGLEGIDFETFENLTELQLATNNNLDKNEWDVNRPSVYETWQQIAKVIVHNDGSFYRPTLAANTHWKNWPESGSL